MTEKYKLNLKCFHTDEILYEGWFQSKKECVEQAVKDSVSLDGVDLTGVNLACANLDDAQMAGANFSKANLNGANLSEGVFDHAHFCGADLSHACLALSSFMNVDFEGASFANTDWTDSIISGGKFSCPSVFLTGLYRAAIFKKCIYISSNNEEFALTKPPVVVLGLPREIVYLDTVVKIGGEFVSKLDLIAAGDRHLEFLYGADVASFIRPALYGDTIKL